MVLLDTHAWLWWAAAADRLSERARAVIETGGEVAVSPMSCWEVATLARKGRIELDRDPELWIHQALGRSEVRLAAISAEIATVAGSLDGSFPGDPADRIIYASARVSRLPLVTADQAIRAFDPPGTVW